MNWDDGKLFLAVARSGQILAASKRLGMNQATLSRRMARLEHSLGTKLIVRRTHGCDLTDEGLSFRIALEKIEKGFHEIEEALTDDASDLAGTVRIGAPDGFGTSFLAPRIKKLADSHPKLVVQLVPVPKKFSLIKRDVDVMVLVGRPETGQLIARKLTDYTLSLYASKKYALKHPLPQTSADLPSHRLVGYVDDLLFSPKLNYIGDITSGWEAGLAVASALGQVEAVRAGAGIGVLHDYLVSATSELVPVLPETQITREYWIAWHSSNNDNSKIRAAVRFIVDAVREASQPFVREC